MDNQAAHNESSSDDTSERPGGVSAAVIVVPLLVVALIAALCFLLFRYSKLFVYHLCMRRAPTSPRVYRDTRMFPDWLEESERARSRRPSAAGATEPYPYIPQAQLAVVPTMMLATRAASLQARLLRHGHEHRERGEAARRLARGAAAEPSATTVQPHAGLVSAAPAPPASQLHR